MKYSNDCVRDILLALESKTTLNTCFDFPYAIKKFPELEKYETDALMYHINQCCESNLLRYKRSHYDNETYIFVFDILPTGHALIETIRNEKAWNNIVKRVGKSIPHITSLAKLLELLEQWRTL